MTDKADCELSIWGIADRSKMTEIYRLIHFFYGNSPANLKKDLEIDTSNQIYIDSVNYGNLEDEIISALDDAGVGYLWRWGAGSEYGSGLRIHDPVAGQDFDFYTVNGCIALPLHMITPENIADAKVAEALIREISSLPLKVADTAHEMAEFALQYPKLIPFLKSAA